MVMKVRRWSMNDDDHRHQQRWLVFRIQLCLKDSDWWSIMFGIVVVAECYVFLWYICGGEVQLMEMCVDCNDDWLCSIHYSYSLCVCLVTHSEIAHWCVFDTDVSSEVEANLDPLTWIDCRGRLRNEGTVEGRKRSSRNLSTPISWSKDRISSITIACNATMQCSQSIDALPHLLFACDSNPNSVSCCFHFHFCPRWWFSLSLLRDTVLYKSKMLHSFYTWCQ